jgi:uncharacterized protein YndB with AHSA1/START domain
MTRKHEGRTVRKEITIAATPADVWDAWAKHDRISQWFVDRQDGDMDKDAIVKWSWDAFGEGFPIHVLEARRGEYLAFGGPDGMQPRALQEIVLRQEGGHTVLRLANSGFLDGADWDEEIEGVDSGWTMALAILKHWLEHHRGLARVHTIAMRPAGHTKDQLAPLYDTSAGLQRWLCARAKLSGEPLVVGQTVALALQGGETLTGEVLARSPTELCMSWRERSGVLTLKSFTMGEQGRCVALAFDAWGTEADACTEVTAILEPALARLCELLGPPQPRAKSSVPPIADRWQA